MARASKPARTAHRAMVAGPAAGFYGASLFTLKEIDEFADCGFFNAETLLTWMSGSGIYSGKPGRMCRRDHRPRCLAGGCRSSLTRDRCRGTFLARLRPQAAEPPVRDSRD